MKVKLFKNKKGSVLVERILMVAFAVAAGGAVIVYGSNVIVDAKNTQITGILGNGGQGQMTQEQLDSHFNDNNHTITLSSSELNSNSFSNLTTEIINTRTNQWQEWNYLNSSYVTMGNKNFAIDEIIPGDLENYTSSGYVWYYSSTYNLDLTFGRSFHNTSCVVQTGINLANGELWQECGCDNGYAASNNPIPFSEGITWYTNCEGFYQMAKAALIMDLG